MLEYFAISSATIVVFAQINKTFLINSFIKFNCYHKEKYVIIISLIPIVLVLKNLDENCNNELFFSSNNNFNLLVF